MSTQPPSPLQLYLQSGLTASSGVDAALLNAPPDAGSNAITEQLANLQLPANESLFAPAGSDLGYSVTAPSASATATDPISAIDTALANFSLFGLGTQESFLIAAIGLWLLLRKPAHKGRR